MKFAGILENTVALDIQLAKIFPIVEVILVITLPEGYAVRLMRIKWIARSQIRFHYLKCR